ncbi:MAG: efflux transporter outer membrane subunit [Bacteroidales bacterium]|nr:efflux transporter outer membrane subunit [Bacteroidales bacterium]
MKIQLLTLLLLLLLFPFFLHAQKVQPQLPEMPATWETSDVASTTDVEALKTWWTLFNDPVLNNLIERATVSNLNAQMALQRIDEAKASLRMVQSNYYPQLNATFSYSPGKTSFAQSGADTRYNFSGLEAGMSWEIDVFGRIRNTAKSQKESFYAAQEDYNAVMTSLIAGIASVYFDIRMEQMRLQVTQSNVLSQTEVLNMSEARFRAGLVSDLDVQQAKSLLANTEGMIPYHEANILVRINVLGALLGEYPWKLRSEIGMIGVLPDEPVGMAYGIPMDVVRRRPDIRKAERMLMAQAAMSGVATSQMLPKLYINGNFGFISEKFEDFFGQSNMLWSITPALRWDFFNGMYYNQNKKMQKILVQEMQYNYQNVVLDAMKEVDNALVCYDKSVVGRNASLKTVEAATKTLSLAMDLYKNGLTNFQNVLDAQRDMLNYADQHVQNQGLVFGYLTDLYKALGGGWDFDADQNKK